MSNLPSTSAKGSEDAMGKITVTFPEALNIWNNTDIVLKLVRASIPSTDEKEVSSTQASILCCQTTY